MQDIVLLLLCVAITGFIGWNVLSILPGRKQAPALSAFEAIGLSYFFGFGAITLEMFVMSFFGMEFTRFNILIPWIPVVLLNAFLYGGGSANPEAAREKRCKKKRVSFSEITLFFLIALQTAYNFLRAVLKPIESYDSVAIHAIKAKMIYLAHGINGSFFKTLSSAFEGAHPDYPLFLPLSEAWIYTFLEKFDDLIVKAIFPLFYISLIFVFYGMVKHLTKRRDVALFFTFLLATVKQFSDYSTIGYADLELGGFFAISAFYLYLWMSEKKHYFLGISLFSSVLCLWTKNEGSLLVLVILAAFFLYTAVNIKRIGKKGLTAFAVYALIAFLAMVGWGVFKALYGLVNENFNFSMVTFRNFAGNLGKIPAILYEYQKQLFGFKKWNIIWILFVIVFLTNFKTAFSKNIKYITSLFILCAMGYASVYIFSTNVEINFFVRTTGSRFLLHVLPLAVFWMALVLYERDKIKKDKG